MPFRDDLPCAAIRMQYAPIRRHIGMACLIAPTRTARQRTSCRNQAGKQSSNQAIRQTGHFPRVCLRYFDHAKHACQSANRGVEKCKG